MSIALPIKPILLVQDWGEMDYLTAWQKQRQLQEEIIAIKLANKENPAVVAANYIIFCTHPPTYTIGKSGKTEHLLLSQEELEAKKIAYYRVDRGGDITFHGDGQLVVYFIWDLEQFKTDLHWFIRTLEAVLIDTLQNYNIVAERYIGHTGVWVDAALPNARKIAAIGLRCSRWVSMHGIALNVNTNLAYFDHIIPCGIVDKAVTSMQQELQICIAMPALSTILYNNVQKHFVDME